MPSQLDHHPNQYDFKTLGELPDSHLWQPDDSVCPLLDPLGPELIPIIDLSSPDKDQVIKLLGQACENPGIFYVVGHGIPTNLSTSAEAQIKRFFALPTEQKLKVARGTIGDGPAGYGTAAINSFYSKLFWSEGYTIIGTMREEAMKLWPNDYHEFSDITDEYAQTMRNLSGNLLKMMLSYLGLNEDEAQQAGPFQNYDKVPLILQLNSYPACPEPEKALGLAEHTDSSFITIIYQGDVPGLQRFQPKDDLGPARWINVPLVPDGLVVSVGDLSQLLSNGRFHSTLHKVSVGSRDRISIAYFCGSADDVLIGPLEKVVGPEGPVYPKFTWPDYVALKKIHYNKTLGLIRLPQNLCKDDHDETEANVINENK